MKQDRTETIKKRYNRIAPVFEWMDRMIREEWRSRLLSQVGGDVLEVGIGTGANLRHYPRGVRLTGIDFSPRMLHYARKRAEQMNLDVCLEEMDAENLRFPDHTFDYVVATCVFCSVPDPFKGMNEMRRVCKPEGKVLLLEHMRSEHPLLGPVMDLLNPVTVRITGANINRRTMDNLRRADFSVVEKEELMGSILRRLTLDPNKSKQN